MTQNKNIAAIQIVAKGLQPLVEPVVFVGGAVVGLYIDSLAVPEIRPTDDVDCVVEVTAVKMALLTQAMIERGFTPTPPVNCRFVYRSVTVDIMPVDPQVLGFTNRWYADAVAQRILYEIAPGVTINIAAFPYYLATKLEAFRDRGLKDPMASTDLEDIITLLDGRETAKFELGGADSHVAKYVRDEFRMLMRLASFSDIVAGHLGAYPAAIAASRRERIVHILRHVASAR
jgi:predicted nucleotidyltransferase